MLTFVFACIFKGIYFLMMLAIFFRVLQDIDPKGKANNEVQPIPSTQARAYSGSFYLAMDHVIFM